LYSDERDLQLNRLFNELKIDNAALVYGTEQKILGDLDYYILQIKTYNELSKGTKLMQGNTLAESIKYFLILLILIQVGLRHGIKEQLLYI
jgi:hypothetical protein